MPSLSRLQLALLIPLTLVWGLNWPVMKLGIADYPPLTFRALSIWLGVPVLGLALVAMKVPFKVARKDWLQLLWLAATNMFVWHACIILAVKALSSGRAAILGYTMPIFSALFGMALFGQRLRARQWGGVGAAALGVVLLLWHEFGAVSGQPFAAFGMLAAAATWALGTQQLRRTKIEAPTLAIIFWMTVLTTLVTSACAVLFERPRWAAPGPTTWFAIGYNALLIFGFAQPLWLVMARNLPPIASSLSVMLIPVLGTVSGALWLHEQLHWQDGAAIALMFVAIGSVLWPAPPATGSGQG